MPFTKTFPVKSERQLDFVETDWRKGLGSSSPNQAVSIDRVAGQVTVVTNEGNTLVFVVKAK